MKAKCVILHKRAEQIKCYGGLWHVSCRCEYLKQKEREEENVSLTVFLPQVPLCAQAEGMRWKQSKEVRSARSYVFRRLISVRRGGKLTGAQRALVSEHA